MKAFVGGFKSNLVLGFLEWVRSNPNGTNPPWLIASTKRVHLNWTWPGPDLVSNPSSSASCWLTNEKEQNPVCFSPFLRLFFSYSERRVGPAISSFAFLKDGRKRGWWFSHGENDGGVEDLFPGICDGIRGEEYALLFFFSFFFFRVFENLLIFGQ